MKTQKKSFFAPLVLVSLGIIFLLNNFGLLPWSIWFSVWRFWPILLILIGIEILLGRAASWKTFLILFVLIFIVPILLFLNPFGGNPFTTTKVNIDEPLASNVRGKVSIDLPAVNLKVKALASDSAQLAVGVMNFSATAPAPIISKNSDQNTLSLTIGQDNTKQIPLIGSFRNDLDLALSNLIPFDVSLKSAASNINLDLTSLSIENLQIESTAGNLFIKFADRVGTKTLVKAGASSVTLELPKNLAVKIKISGGPKNISFPKDRFEQNGEVYQTKEFEKHSIKVEVEMQIGAGNITIR